MESILYVDAIHAVNFFWLVHMLICTTQGYYRRMLDLCHTVHEHWDIFFLSVCCFTVWENTCTYEAASLFCDRPLIPLAYIVCFVWERPSKISARGFSLTSRDWNWGLIEAVHVFPTVPPLPLQWWEGCVFGFVLTHFLLQIQRCWADTLNVRSIRQ